NGAYDAALADFDQAIELEPKHHLAYQRRGELHLERGQSDQAAADLEHAALLSPGNPEVRAALDRAARQRAALADTETTLAEPPSAPPSALAEAPSAQPVE